MSKIPPIPLGLPFALTSVGSCISEVYNFLRLHPLTVKLKNDWSSSTTQSSSSHLPFYNEIDNSLKSSLTDTQYAELLRHINVYINTVIKDKIAAPHESKLSTETSQLIGSIIKENIINYKYTLNPADIERIAGIVKDRLVGELDSKNDNSPFTLSQVNLEEISSAVKADLLKESFMTEVATESRADIDEIVFQIISSPKLFDIVDQRVLAMKTDTSALIASQELMIQKLRDEITQINSRLVDGFSSNKDFKLSMEQLRSHQDTLAAEVGRLERANSDKLDGLLEHIDLKISALNAKQNSAIDLHIREVLMGIMGFKDTDGKALNNDDIENWVRNIFVAKEYLEQRLAELTLNLSKVVKVEINLSAETLMKEITERIKQDTITVIERNNEQLLVKSAEAAASVSARVGGQLNEEDIKRIVQAAMAVYDADKTGLVDYALESAGGEIISTRYVQCVHMLGSYIHKDWFLKLNTHGAAILNTS